VIIANLKLRVPTREPVKTSGCWVYPARWSWFRIAGEPALLAVVGRLVEHEPAVPALWDRVGFGFHAVHRLDHVAHVEPQQPQPLALIFPPRFTRLSFPIQPHCAGWTALCLSVIFVPSCGHDQQLVSITVQPQSETFGAANIPVSADAGLSVQLRALGTYIHPR
jgi:hypothetical protein